MWRLLFHQHGEPAVALRGLLEVILWNVKSMSHGEAKWAPLQKKKNNQFTKLRCNFRGMLEGAVNLWMTLLQGSCSAANRKSLYCSRRFLSVCNWSFQNFSSPEVFSAIGSSIILVTEACSASVVWSLPFAALANHSLLVGMKCINAQAQEKCHRSQI